MVKSLISIGFILYLYDTTTHIPINHAPFYEYFSEKECKEDQEMWVKLSPEWTGVCREVNENKKRKG